MKMEELIPVTLWLAGRGYRIRIKKQEEEAVRLAAKLADERINELRHSYSGKDDQDFLAMCLLMYATDQATEENVLNPIEKNRVLNMIKDIDKIKEFKD